MLRTLNYLYFFLLLQNAAFAQTPSFERISNELGLSQNLITCITQDHRGFLWVGTRDGLNRFDGYTFKVFYNNSFDSTSLSDNYIKSIYEDREGRLWIGTLNGLNLFDRERETFHRIMPAAGNQNSLSHPEINVLLEDQAGALWVGTNGGGLNRISFTPGEKAPLGMQYLHIRKQDGLLNEIVGLLAEDGNGTIWVKMQHLIQKMVPNPGTGGYRLESFGYADLAPEWQEKTSVNQFINKGVPENDDRIYTMFSGSNGTIWFAMAPGFVRWNPASGTYEYFPAVKRFENGVFMLDGIAYGRGIEDNEGRLWVGGFLALAIYDPSVKKFSEAYHAGFADKNSSFYPAVPNIYQDRGGTVWLGTNGYGLFKRTPQSHRFEHFIVSSPRNKGLSIRAIAETASGLLVGMANGDLVKYDRTTRTADLISLNRTGEFRSQPIYVIQEDSKGGLWIGSGGLFHFPDAGDLESAPDFYPLSQERNPHAPVVNVFDIHEDSDGKIWLLTNEAFGTFDPATGVFDKKRYLPPEIGSHNLNNFPCIYQDAEDNFWLGTVDGLKHYDPNTKLFTTLRNNPQNPYSLSHNAIRSIHPDPLHSHIMWVGTAGGGLNRFDKSIGKFTHFKKEQGLPDNVIYGILSDDEGYLWMSTNYGISRFDPLSESFHNYTVDDGLQDNEFNSCAYFKNNEGELFFGGINGFNSFFTHEIKDNSFVPPIVLTDLQLFNQSVAFQPDNSPLKRPITETGEIELSWKDKVFSIEFASLDLSNPAKNQFTYQMEGFDEKWHYIGNHRSVTFTNLDAGKYIFRVAGTNHDGIWNETGASLRISISPPWWATWWAFIVYLGLIIGGLLLLYRASLKRQLEKVEAARLIELDAIKNRLYTNITHEFRTPLTVMLGLANEIEGNERAKELILRNGDNLLHLINQMLDLAKLESGNLRLQLQPVDIIHYLQYLTESFHSLAAAKNIRLTFYTECESLIVDTDEEKLQHIVFNLLSNAIKYTPANGKIVLHTRKIFRTGESFLQIKVWDNGIGIPDKDLTRIFDRFYRVKEDTDRVERQDQGTGIGLAFVKELVNLMGGMISVASEMDKGTTFLVLLPAVNRSITLEPSSLKKYPLRPSEKMIVQPGVAPPDTRVLPVLLLIEDNLDVISYINFLLQHKYRLIIAHNGEEGIRKAFESIPDVILSDVMMPVTDGFEVTETLKNDERTSHIPIILLTAKAAKKDKVLGLMKGADAYLMKPFNKEELFVRLEKLISLRKSLQKRYEIPGLLPTVPASEQTLDDRFLQRLRDLVENRLDDPELSVVTLRKEVNLSQTQFYRKLKALTGHSPIHFIRKLRLQQANELLHNTNMNISEIAYAVGFNDPNYFSRVFQNEMGLTPSEARRI